MADIQKYSEQTFESIKHINEYGQEFWYARGCKLRLSIPNGETSRRS